MTITRAKASALIGGRADLQENKPMAENVEITRNTIAGGEPVFVGQVFQVGVTISEKDARTLVLMGKAKELKPEKKKPVVKKADPVKVKNRDDEVSETVVKRSKKTKKSKK